MAYLSSWTTWMRIARGRKRREQRYFRRSKTVRLGEDIARKISKGTVGSFSNVREVLRNWRTGRDLLSRFGRVQRLLRLIAAYITIAVALILNAEGSVFGRRAKYNI